MKTIKIFAFSLAISLGASHAAVLTDDNHSVAAPVIHVDSLKHDFGPVPKNVVVKHVFRITNMGSAPLIISDVVSSCSCASYSYTLYPIGPGGNGEVIATFNPVKVGPFAHVATIQSNQKGDNRLFIAGEVIAQ